MGEFGADPRGLTVGGAQDDEAMDVFETPSRCAGDGGLHEFAGEPVEEFRMGGE